MISNFKKNCLGTIDFDGKFLGMRKVQRFCVYPLHAGDSAGRLTVQSDTRIGLIRLSDGKVIMSPSRAGGAYSHHLALVEPAGQLSPEDLLLLKSNVFATASGRAGSNGMVYTDNSAALEVFA